jgi:putative membrane protein
MRYQMPLALGAALVASTLSLAAQTSSSTTAPKAHPQTTTKATTAAGKADMADHHFVKEAAQGGMAEVQLGQLAVDKASNSKVKEFGQRMVTDHGKAGDELKSLAASKNITLPTTLSAKDQALKDRLSKLSGATFDRTYMAEMVKDHQADVAAFHKAATTAHDSDIKAWASKTGNLVEEHLKQAQEIQKELGSPKATQ